MTLIGKVLIILLSVVSILSVGMGAVYSLHSRMFLLKKVELVHPSDPFFLKPPLDSQTLLKLATIPIGKVGMFDLNISQIEHQMKAQEWIAGIQFQKKLPDTLVIEVAFRKPRAVLQHGIGSLAYVDKIGQIFGSVNFLNFFDLPLISGISEPAKIRQVLQLLNIWEDSELNRVSWISSVVWDPGKGYRILIGYILGNKGEQVRAMIHLGQEIDESLSGKIARLSTVLRYLSGQSIAARQIWADAGKKVIVKTAPDS